MIKALTEQEFMSNSWITPDHALYKARIAWGYRLGFIKGKPITANKIGRNDPCTCNSGKKYKKCCGRA